MNRYGVRLVVGVLALATLVAVGAYTYNLGVARGLMETGRALEGAGAGVPVVHVWHPWGFGFFPFFPLLFLFLFFFVVRGLLWRGRWHRGGWNHRYEGVPPMFEEWHRRAHARTPDPGSRTADPGSPIPDPGVR